jgi:ATP-dependent RNA helicase SUPV3L1/SUV3
MDEFPEAPPPGLVTIPSIEGVDAQVYTLSGYRRAGARAIRIDMLERLADQLRAEDSRGGFEAKADMLSITGMTLEQFADLMQGLGYKAEKGEREKVRIPPQAGSEANAQPNADAPAEAHPGEPGSSEVEATPEAESPTAPEVHVDHLTGSGTSSVEAQPGADEGPEAHPGEAGTSEAEAVPEADGVEAAAEAPEQEVFFTFTWAGFGRYHAGPRGKGKPREGKPGGGKPRGKPRPKRDDRGGAGKPKSFQSRPPKKEKAIDPDNPFAQALMGLKDKS